LKIFVYLLFKRFVRLAVDDFLDELVVGHAPVAEKNSKALNGAGVDEAFVSAVESFKLSPANSSTREQLEKST
jgi:hypothetical protein